MKLSRQPSVRPRIPQILYQMGTGQPDASASLLRSISSRSSSRSRAPRRVEEQRFQPNLFQCRTRLSPVLSHQCCADVFYVHKVLEGVGCACRAYYHLMYRLRLTKGVCLFLKQESVWAHLLGLAVACAQYRVPVQLQIERNQRLSVGQLFALDIAIQLGATLVEETRLCQVSLLRDADIAGALDAYTDELAEELAEKCRRLGVQQVVLPADQCVFARGDLSADLARKLAADGLRVVVADAVHRDRVDRTSYVQNFSQALTFASFWTRASAGRGLVDEESLGLCFQFLQPNQYAGVRFDSFRTFEEALFADLNARFAGPDAPGADGACYASETELAQAQHLFAFETRCFAARGQLAAVSAVLEQRVARVPSAVVVLDPVFTTLETQDQANFIYGQLAGEPYTTANHLVRAASFRARPEAPMRETMHVLGCLAENGFGARELEILPEEARLRVDIHREPVRYRRMVEQFSGCEDCARVLTYGPGDCEELHFLSPVQGEQDQELTVRAGEGDADP